MPSTETVTHFLARLRKRLDEEVDPGGNLWANAELLEYVNEGCRVVWLTVRETQQNYFMRRIRSTDPSPISLGGRDYDPDELTLRAGRAEFRLPPDFAELKAFESISAESGSSSVSFTHRSLTSPEYRSSQGLDANDSTTSYVFDIEFRLDGPWMVFGPGVGSDISDVALELKYIVRPIDLTLKDTFENSGFDSMMLDAVLAYAVQCALKKAEEGEPNANAKAEWEVKRQEAQRAAGPRQTREPEFVQGMWDDEFDY